MSFPRTSDKKGAQFHTGVGSFSLEPVEGVRQTSIRFSVASAFALYQLWKFGIHTPVPVVASESIAALMASGCETRLNVASSIQSWLGVSSAFLAAV